MGVLRLADGTIVGYRIDGKDYPITMANAQRAVAVLCCTRTYGGPSRSNFTAFELERFSDETGLPLHERHTWRIARGIYFYVTGRADAVASAVTISPQEAPRPKVKRPAARAFGALEAAKKHYEGTLTIAADADLAVRRARTDLDLASSAMGAERAAAVLADVVAHARRAAEAAKDTKACFIAACEACDEAYAAAPILKVAQEAQAADRTLACAHQTEERAADAWRELRDARRLQGTLWSEAERGRAYLSRRIAAEH